MNCLQIQEGGGEKKRRDVFERGGLISSVPSLTSTQIKCNGAAQSTWLEQLGTLAAQRQCGKP